MVQWCRFARPTIAATISYTPRAVLGGPERALAGPGAVRAKTSEPHDRAATLRVGRQRSGDDRLSRSRVGRAGARRPRAVRVPGARGRAGRSVLVDHPAQARGLPPRVPRLRSGEGRALRRARPRAEIG